MTTFEGKVALVTGANTGIGEAAALALRDAGARVFATVRRKDALEAARARHPKLQWLLADVVKPEQVKAAIAAITSEAGRLDVLVNNAGIGIFSSLEESNEDDVREQFEINVLGLSRVTQAALPALRASKGAIVNLSSVVGRKPSPNASHYAATKAAIDSLTRSWALELAPYGVRVNALAPGPVETAGFAKLAPSAELLPAFRAQFVKQVPLGRMASPAEVARWIVAVADPSNTWMTGAVLAIDGGMSLT